MPELGTDLFKTAQAALMLFFVVTSCGALAYTLQGQALTLIDQLPAGARKIARFFGKLRAQSQGRSRRRNRPRMNSRARKSLRRQLIMVLFLTYFMLLSDQLFKRKLVEIVGTLSQ